MLRRTLILLAALVLVTALAAQGAGYVGMILETGDDGVKLNRGAKDSISEGLVLFVVRYGEVVGKVKVTKVEEYSSMAQVLEAKKPLARGDAVYDTPPESSSHGKSATPSAAAGASGDGSKPVATTGASRKASSDGTAQPAPDESAQPASTGAKKSASTKKGVKSVQTNTYTKDFEKAFGKSTKVVQFKAGSGGKLNVSIVDLFQMYNAAQVSSSTTYSYNNYIGSGVVYPSWWPVAAEVGDLYGRYHYSNSQNKRTHTNIQVTYWDEALLNKFAAYFTYKETMSEDKAKRDAIQQSIYRDKGLDKYYVFELVISNGGPGVLQLAPLNWHIYLLDARNSRYKAEKYDQVLDKALNPKQSIRGLIYFARKDASGAEIGSPGSMRLKIEDVLGESSVVSW